MKKIVCILVLIIFSFTILSPLTIVKADSLEETIEKELNGLNLESLENFYNNLDKGDGVDFYTLVYGFINGNYSYDYNSVSEVILDALLHNFSKILKVLISVVIIAIIFSLSENLKGQKSNESIKNVIRITSILAILLIIAGEIRGLFQSVKIVIENMAIFSEIMSPIMLSLIVASGGNVTASIYSPTMVFISNGFINIVLMVLLPLTALITVFGITSTFSDKIKIKKFSDFFASTFKWVIGISITVCTVFMSVQGLSASIVDGVSIKAAKYAISNSVPMIGGFLRDGFDIVTAGTVIIKNVIGITGVFALFYLILSPVLYLIAFSLCFKLISAVIEPFSNDKISGICTVCSKSITYLIVCVLVVGLMLFLNVLILMISSSAFI